MTDAVYAIEACFPPAGAMPLDGSDVRDPAPGTAVWFPLHLLLEQLGRCCRGRCTEPAAYILTEVSQLPGRHVCLPVCAAHACDLARMTEAGHARCPKCHIGWVSDPRLTPEFLAPVLAGGA